MPVQAGIELLYSKYYLLVALAAALGAVALTAGAEALALGADALAAVAEAAAGALAAGAAIVAIENKLNANAAINLVIIVLRVRGDGGDS